MEPSFIRYFSWRDLGASLANSALDATVNFCWRDCPLTGQLAEGANAQCGLVSTTDIPYDELVKAMREVSSTMYHRRYGKAK